MKTIFTCLLAIAIGMFVLVAFAIHDIISQKRLKPIVEKAKSQRTKKGVQKISVHDNDVSENYYLLVSGAIMACCLLVVGSVLFHLISGVSFW